jgi:hypothetical protein
MKMSVEEPPPPSAPAVAAFEKVPFENDASILWKHGTARQFRFVYRYYPEIELIHFVEGEGVELIGDSSRTIKSGHLVLLGSNLPHFWINDAECEYAEACVAPFKREIFGEHLLMLPELARVTVLMDVACRGVAFSRLMTAQAVPLNQISLVVRRAGQKSSRIRFRWVPRATLRFAKAAVRSPTVLVQKSIRFCRFLRRLLSSLSRTSRCRRDPAV